MFYSPLRYPGGKSKLTAYILETIRLNGLNGGVYIEPFAGGAAIAWYLLLEGHVEEVYINDLDLSIYAFWYSVLKDTDALCALIEETEITVDEWRIQKEIQKSTNTSLLHKGFSTLFLNRTNRSGILKAGVIGGLKQDGNYKIDCRFDKTKLIQKIQHIASKRDCINLSNLDGVDFINEIVPHVDDKCLVNIDPPYYVKGKGLYQNFFKHDDHHRLYQSVKNIRQPWIVTYDDTPEINDFYSEFTPRHFGLTYTAQEKRRGSEVIIHNPSLLLSRHRPDIPIKEMDKSIKKSFANRFNSESQYSIAQTS